MNKDLPPEAPYLFRRNIRVVVPSLIQEFVGTIRQIAPRECRDRVDDLSEPRLRTSRLLDRLL